MDYGEDKLVIISSFLYRYFVLFKHNKICVIE